MPTPGSVSSAGPLQRAARASRTLLRFTTNYRRYHKRASRRNAGVPRLPLINPAVPAAVALARSRSSPPCCSTSAAAALLDVDARRAAMGRNSRDVVVTVGVFPASWAAVVVGPAPMMPTFAQPQGLLRPATCRHTGAGTARAAGRRGMRSNGVSTPPGSICTRPTSSVPFWHQRAFGPDQHDRLIVPGVPVSPSGWPRCSPPGSWCRSPPTDTVPMKNPRRV